MKDINYSIHNVYIRYIIVSVMVRKRTRTEALDIDVIDALAEVKGRLARRKEWATRGRMPTYSDAIRELLRKGGY